MLSLYTVCFFGHRRIDDIISVETSVENVIDKVLRQHEYVEFLVGRDGEFDQIVSSAVLQYKKRSDAGNCSLTWVMPYMKSEYAHNRENYDSYYDSVEVCEQSDMAHPKSAIQIRNRAIVDRSDLCVFYVCKKVGGAYQTMKYAANQGKDMPREKDRYGYDKIHKQIRSKHSYSFEVCPRIEKSRS